MNFYFNEMKHLIIYTAILIIVLGFVLYKAIEVIINMIFKTSDIDENWDVQLNIFKLERVMLKTINKAMPY